MDHQDLMQELRTTGLTHGAIISRATESLIQSTAKSQDGGQDGPRVVSMQEHIHRLAAVAEHHFAATSWMGWLSVSTATEQAQTWKAAQQWRRLNPERFGAAADLLTERVRRRYGNDLIEAIERLGADGLDAGADLIEQAVRSRPGTGEGRREEQADWDATRV